MLVVLVDTLLIFHKIKYNFATGIVHLLLQFVLNISYSGSMRIAMYTLPVESECEPVKFLLLRNVPALVPHHTLTLATVTST